MKCSSVLHFIWFFIVCQSSGLGVSPYSNGFLCLVKHVEKQKGSISDNLLSLMNSSTDTFS